MKYICALVVVENIDKARYLYESLLGQTIIKDFGENITFKGDFALHQKSHFKELINNYPISPKSNNFELYFESDDLEVIVERLKDDKIEFIHDIVEQPWRQRVVRFYDYDFNIIEIGESLEHVAYRLYQEKLPIHQICMITYLSEDAVIKSIEEYSQK